MKFMHKREHLEAELSARFDAATGEPRFDRAFVLGALGHHADAAFAAAAVARGLPPICLVLERGGRNLAEQHLAENISGDRDRSDETRAIALFGTATACSCSDSPY